MSLFCRQKQKPILLNENVYFIDPTIAAIPLIDWRYVNIGQDKPQAFILKSDSQVHYCICAPLMPEWVNRYGLMYFGEIHGYLYHT